VSPTRRTVYLILLGVAALVVGAIVLVISKGWSEHLLASACVVGGFAMIVVALPTKGDQ